MVKMVIILLFFILSNIYLLSNISNNLIELKDLTKTIFDLSSEFILFEYKNNFEKILISSI